MLRHRKKVQYNSRNKTTTVVVDSENEEFQQHKLSTPNLRSKTNSPTVNHLNRNPYEKISEIPQVQLSEQDMKGDPIQLILKLQQKYKEYGAVKIKACSEWQPPFSFKYTEKAITTRIQKIHKLSQGKVKLPS